MDPTTFRGIERIVIVLIAGCLAYLGYRLFVLGHTTGPGKLQADTKLGKIVLSGTGPGLFFMAFGAIVLVSAVFHGDASSSSSTTTTTTRPSGPEPATVTTTTTMHAASAAATMPAAVIGHPTAPAVTTVTTTLANAASASAAVPRPAPRNR